MCYPKRKNKSKSYKCLKDSAKQGLWTKVLNIPSQPACYFLMIFMNIYLMTDSCYRVASGSCFQKKVPKLIYLLDFLYFMDVTLFYASTLTEKHFVPTIFGARPGWVQLFEILSLTPMLATWQKVVSPPMNATCYIQLLRLFRIVRILFFNNKCHRQFFWNMFLEIVKRSSLAVLLFLGAYIAYCTVHCQHKTCAGHPCYYFKAQMYYDLFQSFATMSESS